MENPNPNPEATDGQPQSDDVNPESMVLVTTSNPCVDLISPPGDERPVQADWGPMTDFFFTVKPDKDDLQLVRNTRPASPTPETIGDKDDVSKQSSVEAFLLKINQELESIAVTPATPMGPSGRKGTEGSKKTPAAIPNAKRMPSTATHKPSDQSRSSGTRPVTPCKAAPVRPTPSKQQPSNAKVKYSPVKSAADKSKSTTPPPRSRSMRSQNANNNNRGKT